MSPTNKRDRAYPQSPLLAASACIFERAKVLLVLGAHPPKQDLWSLPGGLVEVGETLQQTAARELLEETGLGLSADKLEFADWTEVIKQDGTAIKYHFVIAMFTGHFSGGVLKAGDDAKDARWFHIGKLTQLPMTPGTAERVLKAYDICCGE